MSVDILPSELPLDASRHFSNALMPYLRSLIRQEQDNVSDSDKDRLDALNRATIARHGSLTKAHEWLYTPLKALSANAASTKSSGGSAAETSPASTKLPNGVKPKKKILLLGSGMVAKPAVDEFLKRSDVHLVVGKASQ
jgi:alpha-aminoadipic semialdehyde synthase